MHLDYNWTFLVSLICFAIFFKIKILLIDRFTSGVEIGIKKGLGKPIEELEELKKVLCDKNIFILFFIPESNCGIFLAGTKINDVTGEGIVYCKIDKWEVTDAFDSMNPKSGKTYKFSVVDGISLFTQA